eukprot:jgi/Bigna1/132297/aug1.17_g7005
MLGKRNASSSVGSRVGSQLELSLSTSNLLIKGLMMSADSKLEGGNEQGNSTDGVPDLGSLLHLEMPDVIQNLHVRYSRGQIYTSVSSILVAVNPYKSMPYYGTEFMEKYSAKGKRETVEPHIYNIAENAFRALALKEKSQSIIVCGESGAGKSESAKLLMKHLAFTTSRGSSVTVDGSSPPSDSSAKPKKLMRRMSSTSLKSNTSLAAGNHTSSAVKKRIEFHDFDEEDLELNGEAKEVEARVLSILAVNPILEAFGNAKTVLNNNSSRFGKFTKLQFGKTVDDDGKYIIQGSAISTFLLETSRVVLQSPGERNYHVFYQILYGLTKERRSKWGLTTIFQLIAGILHLGNIEFITNEKEDCLISQESLEHLEMASELFGISLGSLRTLLTYRHIKVGEAIIAKPYDLKAAVVNRDSTAKSIYKGVFDWIVAHINSTMAGDSNGDKKILDIGILDIFGFEVFEDNSFEQLCINLTNERLQHYFNNKIVLSEQKDYIQEAIVWTPVSLPDNKGEITIAAESYFIINDGTEPRFIRCIKPNLEKKCDVWAARLVEDQLESGGLIQALKIIKLGFPTRIEIKKIYALYKNSCCFGDDSSDLKQANPRDVCEAVLFLFFGLSAPDIKIGLTKIFFRENMQDVVSRLLNPMEAKKIVGNTEARHAIKR